jgi:rod shape-determining protein MreD
VRWGIFILALFIALVLDAGFLNVLEIRGVTPAIVPVLTVFVAMGAPRRTALWACFVIGAVVDLSSRMTLAETGAPFHVIGPNAFGFVAGCHLLLPLRTMVFRRNPLTMGVMTLLFMFIASLVAVAILLVRQWIGADFYWLGGTALSELSARGITSLYSSVIAIPVGWLLAISTPLWGFHPSVQRSARW